jgi:hypothetical protein
MIITVHRSASKSVGSRIRQTDLPTNPFNKHLANGSNISHVPIVSFAN